MMTPKRWFSAGVKLMFEETLALQEHKDANNERRYKDAGMYWACYDIFLHARNAVGNDKDPVKEAHMASKAWCLNDHPQVQRALAIVEDLFKQDDV